MKTRKLENTKFFLASFCAFVIDLLWFRLVRVRS